METKIQFTEKLDSFKFYDYNRTVCQSKVDSLVGSILEQNLLAVNPIIVDTEMRVIDGQHRLQACKVLNTGIYYIQAEITDPRKAIPLLNANRANWNNDDYFKFYANSGVEVYQQLKGYMEDRCISNLSTAFVIFSNGSTSAKQFKDGNLVKDEKNWGVIERLQHDSGVSIENYPQKAILGLLQYLNGLKKDITEKQILSLEEKWSYALGQTWGSTLPYVKLFKGQLKIVS